MFRWIRLTSLACGSVFRIVFGITFGIVFWASSQATTLPTGVELVLHPEPNDNCTAFILLTPNQ